MSTPSYRKLEERFRRIIAVDEAADMLYWDQVTMPEGGQSARAEQLAALSVLSHELVTSPQTGQWLAEVDEGALDSWQAANLREMRRKHAHATALTPDLVEAMSRAATVCEAGWRGARREDDFGAVRSLLAEIVNLASQAATAKAEKLAVPPYEALMDAYLAVLTDRSSMMFNCQLAVDAEASQSLAAPHSGTADCYRKKYRTKVRMALTTIDVMMGK